MLVKMKIKKVNEELTRQVLITLKSSLVNDKKKVYEIEQKYEILLSSYKLLMRELLMLQAVHHSQTGAKIIMKTIAIYRQRTKQIKKIHSTYLHAKQRQSHRQVNLTSKCRNIS